jgi:hypothetical protein
MTKSEFLRCSAWGTLGLLGSSALAATGELAPDQLERFDGQEIFTRIVNKSSAEHWARLPMGELIGRIALELKGTPYVGFTLELSRDAEYCVVNLKGLDCVTFFEDSLCMARMIKKGKSSPQDLLREVQFTRYRGGKMGDFTARLHYTSDWLVDNQQKGVVKILTPDLPGAEPFTQKVGFMSRHSEHYRQLKAHPELIAAIRLTEDRINARSLKYLPMDRVKAAEPFLNTGDIVGVTTTEKGIDITHTGLCIKDNEGIVHFMDASSSHENMKVTLESDIGTCLNWSPKLTGVMFARALEVARA